MGQSKRIYEETQEWDAWEHLEEKYGQKKIKVKKMKMDRPLLDKKRK